MGGLGPGIGGLEILVIALLALIVVGPKDLPGMLNKVGRAMAKARAMASEFRASFDEMARQSELDELRKEVEALRRGQGMVPLGAEAEAAFRDIQTDLNQPLTPAPAPLPAPSAPEALPAPEPASGSAPESAIGATPATPADSAPAAVPAKPRAPRKAPAAADGAPAAVRKPRRKAAPATPGADA
ncbi:MAG TPA: Sec-independent protein translocase protein TatB [Brevundimonas sp.]|jgi:sec-independent protein translocase protein TatB|uniref:Sec-independent protein translocase protein TatB n=1 Tax=Brevundimonas sp. TaxID=1871086 RepID=UPI002E15BAA4|nr:Sec-independent protein translocase protein TatB [Brevundimonas sp.]